MAESTVQKDGKTYRITTMKRYGGQVSTTMTEVQIVNGGYQFDYNAHQNSQQVIHPNIRRATKQAVEMAHSNAQKELLCQKTN